MFGSYRFILASLVALSHIGITINGKNPGVFAVVSFYLLSGFLMTGLIRQYYQGLMHYKAFILDRAARIFPQYLFIVVLTLVLILVAPIESHFVSSYTESGLSLLGLINNFTIIPLNYYMFNQSDSFSLIPPAWSLGAELQFYLSIPFILLLGKQFRLALIILSLLVFFAANLNWMHSDWYGYRLLPGILFIFLSGSLIYDAHHGDGKSKKIVWLLFAIVGLWFFVTFELFNKDHPYSFEVSTGLLVAIPMASLLAKLKRQNWDEYLGHLSYGVFLAHFLVLWAAKAILELDLHQSPIGLLAGSIVLAIIGHELIEKPFFAFRRKQRVHKELN